eukprot:PITA_30307
MSNSSIQHMYILTIIDYFTKWVEAILLWKINDDEVTPKPSIDTSPYFSVYGKEAIFPPNLYLPTLKLTQESQGSPCPTIQSYINTLLRLAEEILRTKEKFFVHQSRIKMWFDKTSAGTYEFGVGNLVLKWDRADEDKGKYTKFQALWMGPLQIKEKIGLHTYKLKTLGGWIEPIPLNGQDLKF